MTGGDGIETPMVQDDQIGDLRKQVAPWTEMLATGPPTLTIFD